MHPEQSQGAPIHVPVMPLEVLSYLNISADGIYLDGTVGLGGHATLITNQLSHKGHFIGIDKDEEALSICKQHLSSSPTTVSLFHDSYHNIESILDQLEVQKVNGLILDLGFSSLQLDSNERGFSFSRDGELDMRFDQSQKRTAADIVNNLPVKELADMIYNFGEERRSRSIARSIESQRPLQSVSDLVNAIRSCTPPNHRDRTFSRVFQAIRIKVNDELDRLEYFLSNFINRLALGGRIAIISFHSLEDRLVKHNFKSLAKEGYLSILTKKPLIPSEKEMNKNRKSRSAKLRAAERIY